MATRSLAAFLATGALFSSPPAPRSAVRRAPAVIMTSARKEDSSARAKSLLMQRAAQTQMHYFRDFKNDFGMEWLLRYSRDTGCNDLCKRANDGGGGSLLHHHGAMYGVSWDEYMRGMMAAPEETHEVQVVWGNRIGGGSPENPYLPKNKPPAVYNDTIVPAQIAKQLVAIRTMLADELVDDLKLVAMDNVELRRHHDEVVKNLVDEEQKLRHPIRPADWDNVRETESSPMRQATYDLVKNGVTEQAYELLLDELDRDSMQRHSHEWLCAFGATHAVKWRQESGWHVAQELLLEMMGQPCSVSTSPGGNARFLDPLALADRVMELRLEVAADWSEALLQVPSDHLDLQVESTREELQQRGFGQAWDRN